MDEIISDGSGGVAGALVGSLAVRTAASGPNAGCAASFYVTATPDESYPTTTADGGAMIFLCNAWAVGAVVPAAGGNAGRIVAVVLPDGTIDTRTRAAGWTTGGNQRGYFRAVASASLAAGIYVAGTPGGGGANDLRWVRYGAAATATYIGSPSGGVRFMRTAADPVTGESRLWFSQVGSNVGLNVFSSSSLPNATTPTSLAPGFASYQNTTRYASYGFVFETPSKVWLANDAADKSVTVQAFAYDTGTQSWSAQAETAGRLAGGVSARSLTGRVEERHFVLYATSRSQLWRYSTVTSASTLLTSTDTCYIGFYTYPPLRFRLGLL